MYGAHHAPRYWESPESFDPDVSQSQRQTAHALHLSALRRRTAGLYRQHYAMLQILMILSALLRKYDFQLTPGQTIEPRPMVILRPKHGIRMTFTEAVARDRYAIVQE